jgi:hypothetical protein
MYRSLYAERKTHLDQSRSAFPGDQEYSEYNPTIPNSKAPLLDYKDSPTSLPADPTAEGCVREIHGRSASSYRSEPEAAMDY